MVEGDGAAVSGINERTGAAEIDRTGSSLRPRSWSSQERGDEANAELTTSAGAASGRGSVENLVGLGECMIASCSSACS